MSGNIGGNANINPGMNIRPIVPINMPIGMPLQTIPINQNIINNMNPMFQGPPRKKIKIKKYFLDFMQHGVGMPHMQIPHMPMYNPMIPNYANQVPNLLPSKPVEIKKVWVSHIPPSLSDTFMLKLLESCGPVASWKRTTDQNGRPKGFGFCEFQTVEGMLKALRLLNHLKLEEGYELSIKVDSKVEEFLKHWREQKKMEWIENLRRHGIDVNLEDMKKREITGEPLEWELQLISKDSETRKIIFDILTQKNEIEMYAKQNEKPEEYLKDLKDLTSTTSTFSQHFESEREKERERKKLDKIKKLEKLYKEEEKLWERHEEDMERERKREIEKSEDLLRRKKRLIEKDLNYDSDEEKKKIKQNPRKYEERKIMREKEKDSDALMRKKENPSKNENNNDVLLNDEITDLALVDGNTQIKEPEVKAIITYQEYDEEETNHEVTKTFFSNQNISLNLNVEAKKQNKTNILNVHEEDYDIHDPYHKKKISTFIDINPETEKEILEMNKTAIFYPPEETRVPEPTEKMPEAENISSHGQKSSSSLLANNLDKSKGLLELHKQIYEQIPKSTDELLKFPINWNVITKYDILENKIKPWLGKKLVEYIGEDEPNLKSMIIKKLAQKSSAYELLEKIKPVFEEDTEDFMNKLWKNFIFEMLKAQKLNPSQ